MQFLQTGFVNHVVFRFIDALTPTVANLHPLTILSHLHASCVGHVKSASILKTAENVSKLCQSPTDNKSKEANIYEEVVKTQLQATICLPKVNINELCVLS